MIQFKPQGTLGWLADMLMLPIMFILQGNIHESPQRTHRWNNQKFRTKREMTFIKVLPRISFEGIAQSSRRWFGIAPLFHMPILGGWKKFVVLQPADITKRWFIGWMPSDGESAGISRIPLTGPVRVTIGDGDVSFFALSESGTPLELVSIGEGLIGQAGEFSRIPLR
jgi:hypothetical protein